MLKHEIPRPNSAPLLRLLGAVASGLNRYLPDYRTSLAAQIAKASETKPKVVAESYIQTRDIIKTLEELSALATPREDDEHVRELKSGIWRYTSQTRPENNSRNSQTWHELTDGEVKVVINNDGGTVLSLPANYLGQPGFNEADLNPDFVASTFDTSEFDMRGMQSSRFPLLKSGQVVIGAPLAAHSARVQEIVTDVISAGNRHLAHSTRPLVQSSL